MSEFRCTVPGPPVAKGRPRVAVVNGRARAYTPTRTAEWESRAVAYLRQGWLAAAPVTCAVEVEVVAVFERPNRLTTKRHAGTLDIPHVGKPDGDNVLKAAADALEKAGVLANDSQASTLTVIKRYANNGELAAVHVAVRWADVDGVRQ